MHKNRLTVKLDCIYERKPSSNHGKKPYRTLHNGLSPKMICIRKKNGPEIIPVIALSNAVQNDNNLLIGLWLNSDV